MKQNNEIVLWIEESEQLQAEHQATNSGAASPTTLLFICRPAARRQNEEKIVVGCFVFFSSIKLSSFFFHSTRQREPALNWIEEDKFFFLF